LTNTPVLYTEAAVPLEVAEPIKSITAPVVVELKRTPIMAIQPTGEEVQLADVVTAPPAEELPVAATTIATTTPIADALPATASTLPLIGLIGLMSLCVSLSLRAIEKRAR
jgi:hypothetical protein